MQQGKTVQALLFKTVQALSRQKRRKPKSRARRIADMAAGAVLGGYFLLLCFPQIVFAHSLTYRNFRVYSMDPLSPEIRPILDRADQRLAACEINAPHDVHRIFFCPRHRVFAFFCPTARMAFGVNLPFLHTIFINATDVAGDSVMSGSPQNGRRTLSGVIAHECTHTLLAQRFGQVATLRQPSWKQEGYCDWVAHATSFDPAEGKRLLAQGGSDPSLSFYYFRAYTAVSYLEGRQHWDAPQLMHTPLSLETVLKMAALASDGGRQTRK